MCCHTVKVSVSVFRQFTGKKVQSTEQKYPAWYNGQPLKYQTNLSKF